MMPHGIDFGFTEEALWVLRKRILLADQAGNPLETPEQMFRRVAWEIARVERRYLRREDLADITKRFYETMQALIFFPILRHS